MATLKVVGASWMRTKISSYVLCLLGVLAILALILGQIERTPESGNYAATVYYSAKGYKIEFHGQSNNLAEVDRGVARAFFRTDVDTAGWSLLEVETDGSYRDEVQAYAAGVVEGALTWYLINTHLTNTKCENKYPEKQCDKLKDFLDKSVNIWKHHADDRGRHDPFWHQVSLYFTQIDGIQTGWKYGMERNMIEDEVDSSDINWLNFVSEVAEIQHKLNITMEDPELRHLPGLSTAFLKIVNETSDDGTDTRKLFVAQNAAGSYAGMTKILKRYKFNYHQTSQDNITIPVNQVDFSSYPGTVTSQDEFYVLNGEKQRMVVTGTTLKNYNPKLWKEVNIIEQLPLGPRVSAANRLATSVSTWGHVLATNNSGTGCKQWLVVDFNRFNSLNDVTPAADEGKEVVTEINVNNDVKHTVVHPAQPGHASGLLWLIEQVPGLTHARDMTTTLLDQGYFTTYGLPILDDVSKMTHISKMQTLYGAMFSLSESPKAATFRNGSKNATTLDSVIKLMRQNNITAIRNNGTECSDEVECIIEVEGLWSFPGVRGDIVNKHKIAYGIVDTKVVIGTVNQPSLEFIAVAGPPYTDVPMSNGTKTLVNKGNVASIYTDQFNNQTNFDALEIRDLVKQQMEEAEEEAQAELEKDIIKPFQWSLSQFKNLSHIGLPDTWAFKQYKPNWSW